jgi:hypothetical protein
MFAPDYRKFAQAGTPPAPEAPRSVN